MWVEIVEIQNKSVFDDVDFIGVLINEPVKLIEKDFNPDTHDIGFLKSEILDDTEIYITEKYEQIIFNLN